MLGKVNETEAWVIKIGGSLYNSNNLTTWLDKISKYTSKKIIIVPGGGPFADQVRRADEKFKLEKNLAHHMAVMGMQQYAGVLKSLCPALSTANSAEKIQQEWKASKSVIWEPFEMVRDQCSLAHSWDISSDSLAVWLAGKLGINNILLVKSSKRLLDNSGLSALVENGCIDPGIEELAISNKVKLHFAHESKLNRLNESLNSV